MVNHISESSAQTERALKKHQKLSDELSFVNARPILSGRIRHLDGRFSKFDITKLTDSLERSMLSIGGALNTENQTLVCDLAAQVINVIVEGMSADGVMDIDDLQTQIEMTLMLNGQFELAKAYQQVIAAD